MNEPHFQIQVGDPLAIPFISVYVLNASGVFTTSQLLATLPSQKSIEESADLALYKQLVSTFTNDHILPSTPAEFIEAHGFDELKRVLFNWIKKDTGHAELGDLVSEDLLRRVRIRL